MEQALGYQVCFFEGWSFISQVIYFPAVTYFPKKNQKSTHISQKIWEISVFPAGHIFPKKTHLFPRSHIPGHIFPKKHTYFPIFWEICDLGNKWLNLPSIPTTTSAWILHSVRMYFHFFVFSKIRAVFSKIRAVFSTIRAVFSNIREYFPK